VVVLGLLLISYSAESIFKRTIFLEFCVSVVCSQVMTFDHSYRNSHN
jgi:hypothetical protein